MILCDAGPLVALIDRGDQYHLRCAIVLEGLGDETLVTTWPCLAEVMYLVGRVGGHRPQEAVWALVAKGIVLLDTPEPDEWGRMRDLMDQYRDLPMDLADASLVAAAERLGLRRVYTLDSHFRAYRVGGDSFDVIP